MDREIKDFLLHAARAGNKKALQVWFNDHKDSLDLIELNNLFDNSELIALADRGFIKVLSCLLENKIVIKPESSIPATRLYAVDRVDDLLVYYIKMIGARLSRIYEDYHRCVFGGVYSEEKASLQLLQMECLLLLAPNAGAVEYYRCGINDGKTFLQHAVLDGQHLVVRLLLKHEAAFNQTESKVEIAGVLPVIYEDVDEDVEKIDDEFDIYAKKMVVFRYTELVKPAAHRTKRVYEFCAAHDGKKYELK